MHLDSIGLRTDLIFWRHGGRVADRGEYLLVETPGNPGWHFGNLLVFGRGPREGDFERWTALFREEFAHAPGVRHVNFAWRVEEEGFGETGPFLAAGFRLEVNPVLVARALTPPPRPNGEIEVRPVETDESWSEVLEAHVRGREPQYEEGGYRRFLTGRFVEYRALAAEGRGGWYGAYAGGGLVGDLGLFREGRLGRYQLVLTREDFRRRGVCATLVHAVGAAALAEGRVGELVISAADEAVARIYRSVGFEPAERCAALVRGPG